MRGGGEAHEMKMKPAAINVLLLPLPTWPPRLTNFVGGTPGPRFGAP